MLKFFDRLWAAIVGVVAGVSIGLVATLMLMMFRVSADLVWMIVVFGIIGGLAGLILGNKRVGKP